MADEVHDTDKSLRPTFNEFREAAGRLRGDTFDTGLYVLIGDGYPPEFGVRVKDRADRAALIETVRALLVRLEGETPAVVNGEPLVDEDEMATMTPDERRAEVRRTLAKGLREAADRAERGEIDALAMLEIPTDGAAMSDVLLDATTFKGSARLVRGLRILAASEDEDFRTTALAFVEDSEDQREVAPGVSSGEMPS